MTPMRFDAPYIGARALEAITAPTLVPAGDHDMIRDEHTSSLPTGSST